jgi:hypothetical protein
VGSCDISLTRVMERVGYRKRIYGAPTARHHKKQNLSAVGSYLRANPVRSFFFHCVHINSLPGENPSPIGAPCDSAPSSFSPLTPPPQARSRAFSSFFPARPPAPLRRAAAKTRGRREVAGVAGVWRRGGRRGGWRSGRLGMAASAGAGMRHSGRWWQWLSVLLAGQDLPLHHDPSSCIGAE